MTPLVLSLFPGIGLLDRAFEEEGFWHLLHHEPQRPTREHASLELWNQVAKLRLIAVRADHVRESRERLARRPTDHAVELPRRRMKRLHVTAPKHVWPAHDTDAPLPTVRGYNVDSRLLNNRWLGETSNRLRRISFGTRAETLQWMALPVMVEALMPAEFEYAAVGGSSAIPIKIGGSGKVKAGRRLSPLPMNHKGAKAFRELVRKQGLPEGFDLPPFTVTAKCQALGNGVPLAMGRAIAKAVKRAIYEQAA